MNNVKCFVKKSQKVVKFYKMSVQLLQSAPDKKLAKRAEKVGAGLDRTDEIII